VRRIGKAERRAGEAKNGKATERRDGTQNGVGDERFGLD